MNYDIILPEGYECDVNKTITRVINTCDELLEEYDLQSTSNSKTGLDYFDNVEIQSPNRDLLITIAFSLHELLDVDEDGEAIWTASQMTNDGIRQVIINKIITSINESLDDELIDAIHRLPEPTDICEVWDWYDHIHELRNEYDCLQNICNRLKNITEES